MRIPGYKLVILVLSVTIVFLLLHQLGYSYERSGLTASWLLGATTPLDVLNKTESESEGQNKSLYYSALPGTSNNWTLLDIRRQQTSRTDWIEVEYLLIKSIFILFILLTRSDLIEGF